MYMETLNSKKMTEKERENVKRGGVLVSNFWSDNESRTWKFEFGYGESITAFVDGVKVIEDEEILSVFDNYDLWLPHGTISLGGIIENNIVGVMYKNNSWVLRKI